MPSGRKWFSVKINMDGYFLLRKLSATLNLRQYQVMYAALSLMYFLLIDDADKARQVLNMLKERMERQKWAVDSILKTLDEVLER